MAQYAFYFDSDSCTGCKTCQVACKETYGLPAEVLWRRVYNYQGGSWDFDDTSEAYVPNGVFGYFVSMACNHCAAPACVAVCPVGAISKDPETGIVAIDEEMCISCGSCAEACPYGVPTFWESKGVFTKCNMCSDLVAEGDVPLCVSGCNMRALDFGTIDDLKSKYGAGDVEVEPLPEDSTGPSLILNPHRNAQKTGTGTGNTVNFEEEI